MSLELSPDKKGLLVGSFGDSRLAYWDLASDVSSHSTQPILFAPDGEIRNCAVSSSCVAVAGGQILAWDLQEARSLSGTVHDDYAITLNGHSGSIKAMRFNALGTMVRLKSSFVITLFLFSIQEAKICKLFIPPILSV